MDILFFQKEISESGRMAVNEYFQNLRVHIIFSKSFIDVIEILNRNNIKWIIIFISRIEDINLIRYLREHYARTRIILYADKEVKNIPELISSNDIYLMEDLLKLTDIRHHMILASRTKNFEVN